MSQAFQIRQLLETDIHDNVALARAVGWHDTDGDWRVIHEAAHVMGVRLAGRLIAQGALGLCGSAGTIAKLVVAPEFQRQGLGARLLHALLREATARSLSVLGLVASPFGRSLYAQNSFCCVGEVIVLTGTPNAGKTPDPLPLLETAETAIRVEEPWIGRLRAAMLRARFREAVATAAVADPNGEPRGYAMATLQGPFALIGPLLAETEDHARALVHTLFRSVASPVRIDVPAEHTAFRSWLRAFGLHEQAVRTEMASGAHRLPWQVPQRFALATQAWG